MEGRKGWFKEGGCCVRLERRRSSTMLYLCLWHACIKSPPTSLLSSKTTTLSGSGDINESCGGHSPFFPWLWTNFSPSLPHASRWTFSWTVNKSFYYYSPPGQDFPPWHGQEALTLDGPDSGLSLHLLNLLMTLLLSLALALSLTCKNTEEHAICFLYYGSHANEEEEDAWRLPPSFCVPPACLPTCWDLGEALGGLLEGPGWCSYAACGEEKKEDILVECQQSVSVSQEERILLHFLNPILVLCHGFLFFNCWALYRIASHWAGWWSPLLDIILIASPLWFRLGRKFKDVHSLSSQREKPDKINMAL